jgi:purine-binding chemotaxis protein CheW
MNQPKQLLVFNLDEQRYALPLSDVERIVRAVEITPLPKAPEIVLGVINVRGQVIPVVNIRKRFRLPEREITLNDHLIIAQTSRRAVALLADRAGHVLEVLENKIISAKKILPAMDYVEGVIKLEDGLILIHDLEKFLSLEEEKAINDQLTGLGNQGSGEKND